VKQRLINFPKNFVQPLLDDFDLSIKISVSALKLQNLIDFPKMP
jgi:hypothetical protein